MALGGPSHPACRSSGLQIFDILTSEYTSWTSKLGWGILQESYDSLCSASKPMGCRAPPGASPAHTKVVAVDQPGGFSWWLGVRNVNRGGLTYKLTTSYTVTPCPSECSGNGECLRGRCYCNAGFVGEDCAMKEPTRYTALQFGTRTPGYVGPSGWRYYYVNTDRSTSSLVVELELPKTGTHGTPTAPVGLYLNRCVSVCLSAPPLGVSRPAIAHPSTDCRRRRRRPKSKKLKANPTVLVNTFDERRSA